MAKKNTSKAKHQPKDAKMNNAKVKSKMNDQETSELDPIVDTEINEELPITEPLCVVKEPVSEVVLFDPNQPIEIYFELGIEEIEPNPDVLTIETTEQLDSITSTNKPNSKPSKTRKTKLGTDQTAKLAACSYHFFRKYFKKRYAEEGIKVRFVKEATGYNGHMEVAESDIEKAKGIILKIKAENTEVKNLFWFV